MDTPDVILHILIMGVAATYPLKCLILEPKTSHEGPFKSKSKHVYFRDEEHTQAVALFDWFRRLFGVYKVEGDIWRVVHNRYEYFSCPFCLSFWVAFLFSVPYTLITEQYLWSVVTHFAIAIISRICYKVIFDE
mgnify:CR=1 FL=1